jgi:hypothetical protein
MYGNMFTGCSVRGNRTAAIQLTFEGEILRPCSTDRHHIRGCGIDCVCEVNLSDDWKNFSSVNVLVSFKNIRWPHLGITDIAHRYLFYVILLIGVRHESQSFWLCKILNPFLGHIFSWGTYFSISN